MDGNTFLPLRYARLIVAYTHGLLSDAEADDLDEWICALDENLEIFEHLTGEVAHNIVDPESVIEETDDILELWVIAGLIARELKNDINEMQKTMLAEWIAASEHNEKMYKTLSNPANFQKFILWFKQLWQRNNRGTGFN